MNTYTCQTCGSSFTVKEWRRHTPRYCSSTCYSKRYGSPESRFWQNVDKGDECWLWTGALAPNGYGKFFADGYISSHRFSFLLHFGYLPEVVCHRCDIKRCVRPDHLFGGTQLDNVVDRDTKGRTHTGVKPNRAGKGTGLSNGSYTRPESRRIGERNGRVKLTEEQVRVIRRRFAAGETNKSALAREFGVSNVQIDWIVKRKSWAHLPD